MQMLRNVYTLLKYDSTIKYLKHIHFAVLPSHKSTSGRHRISNKPFNIIKKWCYSLILSSLFSLYSFILILVYIQDSIPVIKYTKCQVWNMKIKGAKEKKVATETFKMLLLKKVRSRFSSSVTVFRLVTFILK